MDKIVEKNGKLYVASTFYMYDEPVRITNYYPTGLRAVDYPLWIGKEAKYYSGGLYHVQTTGYDSTLLRLPEGGSTKCEFQDKEEVHPPKRVRSELRWSFKGYWEKYDKRKGWVVA